MVSLITGLPPSSTAPDHTALARWDMPIARMVRWRTEDGGGGDPVGLAYAEGSLPPVGMS